MVFASERQTLVFVNRVRRLADSLVLVLVLLLELPLEGRPQAARRQAPVPLVHVRVDAQRGGHVSVRVGDGAAVRAFVSRSDVIDLQADFSRLGVVGHLNLAVGPEGLALAGPSGTDSIFTNL